MARPVSERARGSLAGGVILGLGALWAWWLYGAPAGSLQGASRAFLGAGLAGVVFLAGVVVGTFAARRAGTGGHGPGGGDEEPRPEGPVDDIDAEFWRIVNVQPASG
jgi:hypothetical protein